MSAHHDPLSHHKKAYAVVWVLLLVFTVITVWTAYHDFGVFNIVVAMAIASIKATLVILFFMHLKYDNKTNQVVFASSFVFLAIFAGLTLSDELFRPDQAKANVEAIEAPAGNVAAENELLRQPTPELIAHGKETFAVQCVTCHGVTGQGNGPAASALNPKPRDFTSGVWKQGGTPSEIFKTISGGIPGSSMAAFDSLPSKDRWSLVHFVRTFAPNSPEDTPETLKASGLFGDGERKGQTTKSKLPIEFAIDRMVKEATEKQKQ